MAPSAINDNLKMLSSTNGQGIKMRHSIQNVWLIFPLYLNVIHSSTESGILSSHSVSFYLTLRLIENTFSCNSAVVDFMNDWTVSNTKHFMRVLCVYGGGGFLRLLRIVFFFVAILLQINCNGYSCDWRSVAFFKFLIFNLSCNVSSISNQSFADAHSSSITRLTLPMPMACQEH